MVYGNIDGYNSNNFFLKDNNKVFILWLNVPKVAAYLHCYLRHRFDKSISM